MEIETNKNPQTTATAKKNRVFFAKLWVNTSKDGKKYMSGNIDNKFSKFAIGLNDQIQIWKNTKRDGKKDPDFRVSLLTDQEIPEGINGPVKQKEVTSDEIDAVMAS